MNVRKAVDYSSMFESLDSIMKTGRSQMELYCKIGQAVCSRPEKGAAVAAAGYLTKRYPDIAGFSPRNIRRMRGFWRIYGHVPELLAEAMLLNWTQNIVILEAALTMEERKWYIHQAAAHSLSKAELLRMLAASAHLESALDEKAAAWYNKEK